MEEKDYSNLPKVRTYATDMAKAVKEGKGSIIKIAVAEQEKRQASGESSSTKGGKGTLLIGIAILIIGIAGIIFFFAAIVFTPKTVPIEERQAIPSLITADLNSQIDISGIAPAVLVGKLLEEVDSQPATLPAIENIYFVEEGPTGYQFVTTNRFFTKLETSMSVFLLNSLNPLFTYGSYHDQRGSHPFVVIKSENYDETFQGLRLWETTMLPDMNRLLHLGYSQEALTTLKNQPFTDTTIGNAYTRYLSGSTGKAIFYYQIIDQRIVLFAQDIETLEAVRAAYLASIRGE